MFISGKPSPTSTVASPHLVDSVANYNQMCPTVQCCGIKNDSIWQDYHFIKITSNVKVQVGNTGVKQPRK